MLDTTTKNFYNKNGYYLFHEPVFSSTKFEELKSIFEELNEKNKTSPVDLMDVPHFRDASLLEFLMSERVLDLVETFIGPNIGLWSSHFISKEPLVGRATPWHEDSAYWEGRFDSMDKIVTLWLAIDHSNKENGCMKVIPATHHNGFSEYEDVDQSNNIFHNQIIGVDNSKATYFELTPNECSFHDSRIIHGAEANKSTHRRTGYTMRYFSQEMKFFANNPNNKGHKIWHCRGKNIHGNLVEN